MDDARSEDGLDEDIAGGDGEGADISDGLRGLLTQSRRLYIQQHRRAWLEILLNWEQRNEYSVAFDTGGHAATIIEQPGSFLRVVSRLFLGSLRPMDVTVFSRGGEPLLDLTRPFHLLFSSLEVQSPAGRVLGRVQRRFGLWTRFYDLLDFDGELFARIQSPLWRVFTFPVRDLDGNQAAEISKKWSGLVQEYFTDADNFRIDFAETPWSLTQRAVILAAAISIDMDFFENNQSR